MGTKLDSSTDILTGQFHLFIGEDVIAFGKSASLEISVDEIDISNKMMGDWAGALSGKKSFTVQCDSLYSEKGESYSKLLEKLKAGKPMEFSFSQATASDQDAFGGTFEKSTPVASGKVIITSLNLQSNVGEVAQCSATFKGVGAIK